MKTRLPVVLPVAILSVLVLAPAGSALPDMVLAGLTMTLGNLVALAQDNVKRMRMKMRWIVFQSRV